MNSEKERVREKKKRQKLNEKRKNFWQSMFTKRNWKTKLSTKKVYNLIRKIKGIRLIE